MIGNTKEVRVLLVTTDALWRRTCMDLFRKEGCVAYTADSGIQAMALLHTYLFNIISIDDSLMDFGVIELSLTIEDIAPNKPFLLVTGKDIGKFSDVLQRFGIFSIGTKKEFPKNLRRAIKIAAYRGHPGQSSPKTFSSPPPSSPLRSEALGGHNKYKEMI